MKILLIMALFAVGCECKESAQTSLEDICTKERIRIDTYHGFSKVKCEKTELYYYYSTGGSASTGIPITKEQWDELTKLNNSLKINDRL